MPPTTPARKYIWLLFLAPPAVAAIALLLAGHNLWLDRETFERLIMAFGGTVPPQAMMALEANRLLWLETLLFLLFATAATLGGFMLGSVARTIVVLQLFVLSLLVQWGFWYWGKAAGHPLGFFLCIALGWLAGFGVRMLDRQEHRFESQYYEILLRNRELQETKLQLVKQDEIERRMLAADLHDQVLNDLKSIRQKLEDYESSKDPAMAESIKGLLGQAMEEIREVMDSLCPSALEHLGLVAAIEDCLRRGAERAGFKSRMKNKVTDGALDELSMVEKSLLYRLVQESVTNICKHAAAAIVRGNIELDNTQLVIQITDDGKGIDPAKIRDDSRGVRYMRQRGDLIGATISWSPGEGGRGTMVEIRMNLAGRKDG